MEKTSKFKNMLKKANLKNIKNEVIMREVHEIFQNFYMLIQFTCFCIEYKKGIKVEKEQKI